MMRLIVLSAVLAVAFAAYNGDPKLAAILRLDSDILPDGTYQWAYDTENGISAQAQGVVKQAGTETIEEVRGGFQYQSPEGDNIQLSYVADENGYQPTGNALPTPPPVPPQIQRALEWIAAHPQAAEGVPLNQRRF